MALNYFSKCQRRDLLTEEAIPLVSDTHKNSDFVEFLARLDAKYPEVDKIRLILDDHSAHTSQETQRYLNDHIGRFEFVFTPTHGSWLNMVEGFSANSQSKCFRVYELLARKN